MLNKFILFSLTIKIQNTTTYNQLIVILQLKVSNITVNLTIKTYFSKCINLNIITLILLNNNLQAFKSMTS